LILFISLFFYLEVRLSKSGKTIGSLDFCLNNLYI